MDIGVKIIPPYSIFAWVYIFLRLESGRLHSYMFYILGVTVSKLANLTAILRCAFVQNVH